MKQQIYAIRDSKAEMYHQPFHSLTHGEAERNFAQLTKDEKSLISQYPEDYDLFHLGTYDSQTGQIQALATPSHVAKAISLSKSSLN